jgi:polysaccharide export outer membrane protein
MRINKLLIIVLSCLMFASCATRKQIAYFQDAVNADSAKIALASPEVHFRPDDKVSIVVSCRDPELTNMFNLPYTARYVGSQTLTSATSSNQGLMCYTIDPEGNIDFPELGKVHVAGFTRSELAAYIKGQLIGRNLIQDPVVTVEFANLQFSVIGEVKNPGRYNINRDKVTILDAISMAGDMTINGKRKDVQVVRTDSLGNVMTYTVDFTSIDSVKNSPVYYLAQNDLVYVEPSKKRTRESEASGNTFSTPSFWISIISALSTIATTTILIINNTNK